MESLETINPNNLTLSAIQFEVLVPYIIVIVGILLSMLACTIKSISPKWPAFGIAFGATIAAIIASVMLIGTDRTEVFNAMMVADEYSHFFNILFLVSAAVTMAISFRYLERESLQYPEYYVLILFSAVGMMFMASAQDLMVIFIALELMSLTTYTLVGFRRSDRLSNEAAMKYFILGGAASAIFLYGVALLYGATASTSIKEILNFIYFSTGADSIPMLFTLGSWLVIVGFLFKVASVPFHMWMPDVYEGAPAPVTGFMTTGLKAAAFATFVRVFISLGYGPEQAELLQGYVYNIIWVCAVLTMVIGNVVALAQTNLKRMLAYSSIAHTGYLLVGMLAGSYSEQGYAPVAMYLVAYSIMNLGAFVILSVLAKKGDGGLTLQDMAGLSRRHPWLAFSMAVFLFSMAGIPPTAGFVAKYLMFYGAVQAGEIVLTVIAVLASAVSVYYYLRVMVFMYMKDPETEAQDAPIGIWSGVSVALMVVLTLQFGFMPQALIEAAKRAVLSLG